MAICSQSKDVNPFNVSSFVATFTGSCFCFAILSALDFKSCRNLVKVCFAIGVADEGCLDTSNGNPPEPFSKQPWIASPARSSSTGTIIDAKSITANGCELK